MFFFSVSALWFFQSGPLSDGGLVFFSDKMLFNFFMFIIFCVSVSSVWFGCEVFWLLSFCGSFLLEYSCFSVYGVSIPLVIIINIIINMIDSLSIAVHAFVSRVPMSFSVDETLFPRLVNLSTSFREVPSSVEISPACLKHIYIQFCEWPIKWNAVSSKKQSFQYCCMDASLGR